MYDVSTQGIDERMVNVHYYYYSRKAAPPVLCRIHLYLRFALFPSCKKQRKEALFL